MQGTMMKYPLTLQHSLERAGKLFPRVEILSRLPDHSLHRYTYGDFYRRTRLLAEALQKAGLRRGDRVGTLMWNHYAHLEAYFGIPVSGGVLQTLNLRLAAHDLAYIANHAGDRFLIVDDILLPLYDKIKNAVKFERVIVVPLTGNPVSREYQSYEDFLATASGDFTYPVLDEDEAASLCYTSGTTGAPKGVIYTHRSVMLHSFLLTTVDNFWHMQRRRAVARGFHVSCQRLGIVVRGGDRGLQTSAAGTVPGRGKPSGIVRPGKGHLVAGGATHHLVQRGGGARGSIPDAGSCRRCGS